MSIKHLDEAEEQEFLDWAAMGIDRGWISDITCVTHHGLPNTKEEEKEWEEGYDPCVPGIRVWVV